jgi:hypothetical protein
MILFKVERKREEPRNKKVDLFITHILSEEVLQLPENLSQEEDVEAQEAALVDVQIFKLESMPLKPG